MTLLEASRKAFTFSNLSASFLQARFNFVDTADCCEHSNKIWPWNVTQSKGPFHVKLTQHLINPPCISTKFCKLTEYYMWVINMEVFLTISLTLKDNAFWTFKFPLPEICFTKILATLVLNEMATLPCTDRKLSKGLWFGMPHTIQDSILTFWPERWNPTLIMRSWNASSNCVHDMA